MWSIAAPAEEIVGGLTERVSRGRRATRQMQLAGVVTNIGAFGAFVDVGVPQDGLVRVSQLADRYVTDPNQVVAVGQRVSMRVRRVDLPRNRTTLRMRTVAAGGAWPVVGRGATKAAPVAFTIPKPGAIAPNAVRFR